MSKPIWNKVETEQKALDNILTRFREKVKPLVEQLDEAVKKLNAEVEREKHKQEKESPDGDP